MALTKQDENIIRLQASQAALMNVAEMLVQTIARLAPATTLPMVEALRQMEATASKWTFPRVEPEYSMLYAQIYQEEVSAVAQGLRSALGAP